MHFTLNLKEFSLFAFFFVGKNLSGNLFVQMLSGKWCTKNGKIVIRKIFRQIICWQSRSTTTVTAVKLHYFRGRGSTMAVAVKNQVQLKKLRIAKFIQKWKKNFLLPLPWYYHGHGSSVISFPSLWQYRSPTSR